MKDSDNSNLLLPNSGNTMVQDGLSETREALARAAKMSLAGSRWHGWRPVADLVVVICFILAMIVLLIQPDGEMVPRPSVDTVAQDTIRAGRDVLLEDESATKSRREEAKAAVSEVFDYNSDLYFSLGDKVLLALVNMKKAQQNNVLSQADRRLAFQKEIGVAVNSGVFALIDGLDDPADAALAINFFLNFGLDRYVIADRSLLPVGRGLEIWESSVAIREES